MDLNNSDNSTASSSKETAAQELVRSADVLPGVIHVLPLANRPFFPGQAMPLVVESDPWLSTLEAVGNSQHKVLGLVLVKTPAAEEAGPDDFYSMGTACRVHQIQKHKDKLQIMVAGLQRIRIDRWVSRKPVNSAL